MKITQEMVNAALVVLGEEGYVVTASVMRHALDDAIRLAPEVVGETSRERAMRLAKVEVDSMCVPPTKSNGYTVDGWKAPSLSERVQAIRELASLLMEDEGPASTVEVWQGGR